MTDYKLNLRRLVDIEEKLYLERVTQFNQYNLFIFKALSILS